MSGPDYRLCDSVVTVYRRREDGSVQRTVYPRAYLEQSKAGNTHTTAGRSVSKIGMNEKTEALLVVPWCEEPCPVAPGDKALRGLGPEEAGLVWSELAPARYPGVIVLRHAELKYWRGRPCHFEAGG